MEKGLSKIKDPKARADADEAIKRHMNARDPLKSVMADTGLTKSILQRQGLPLLRSGIIADQIKKIPGAGFVVPYVEKYFNDNAPDDVTTPAGNNPVNMPTRTAQVANIPAGSVQRSGNPFPPINKTAGNPFPPIKPK